MRMESRSEKRRKEGTPMAGERPLRIQSLFLMTRVAAQTARKDSRKKTERVSCKRPRSENQKRNS